jgi:DNA-binding NtrC family response regulator
MKLVSIPAIKYGAIEKLMTYSWPGNVRELENIVERSLIIRKSDVIEFPDFEIKEVRSPKTTLPLPNQDTFELDMIVAEHIRKVLQMTNGKIEGKDGAAELLKVNPATLRNRMRKLRIEFGRK